MRRQVIDRHAVYGSDDGGDSKQNKDGPQQHSIKRQSEKRLWHREQDEALGAHHDGGALHGDAAHLGARFSIDRHHRREHPRDPDRDHREKAVPGVGGEEERDATEEEPVGDAIQRRHAGDATGG